jgi:cell division protein FtsI (penicillin-binding protein 3)
VKSRIIIVVLVLGLWSGLIAARLYQLQIAEHERYREIAADQQLDELTVTPPRGAILDVRGRELAVSVTVDSAYIDPGMVEDPRALIETLREYPELDARAAQQGFDKKRRFTWVGRKLDPELTQELRDRDLPDLHFAPESRRCYPMGRLAGPVLGFVGVDPRGLEGLEARFERQLAGNSAERTVLRDALRGTLLFPSMSFSEAEPGLDLHLTIDASIQYIVERELRAAVEKHNAASGSAVFLDPWTGAILAMASVPDFDPNDFGRAPKDNWRNRVVTDVYEPGSTFKVITAAAALEANLVDPSDVFDCENGGIVVAGKRINDHKSFGDLTFREVIANSSNVGAIKLGQLAGDEALYEQIRAFGVGSLTGIDLPGESAGIVHPVESWGKRGGAYISFGQGISMTALQLANVFAAIGNGGYLYQPYIVEGLARDGRLEPMSERPVLLGRPIGPATARSLERLLESVVEEGTGKRAAVPGYRVAGKTGTAQMAVPGGYAPNSFIASFAGFAPARKPALVGVIRIDEPRGQYHGGDVAAPVFSAIAEQALFYLGVPPDRDVPAAWPGELLASADPEASPIAPLPLLPPASDAGPVEAVQLTQAQEADVAGD